MSVYTSTITFSKYVKSSLKITSREQRQWYCSWNTFPITRGIAILIIWKNKIKCGVKRLCDTECVESDIQIAILRVPTHENMLINTFINVSDVMVLNDIIEQAAGRHSRGSDKAGTPNDWFVYVMVKTLSNVFIIMINILM